MAFVGTSLLAVCPIEPRGTASESGFAPNLSSKYVPPNEVLIVVPVVLVYQAQWQVLASFPGGLIGQSASALPSGSDVDLLGDGESIIDLNAEIPDSALDLRVPKEQLNGPQVAGSPVNQGRLGSTQGMCPKE